SDRRGHHLLARPDITGSNPHPGMKHREKTTSYTLWLRDTAVASWATVDFEEDRTEFEVVQSGPRKLWDEVEKAYRWWEAQGQPGFQRFGLTVSTKGETVWLDDPRNPVPPVLG
ncbi:hypothetical protein AB0L75_38330, partial [Streptomyces sp. NPDC052101]